MSDATLRGSLRVPDGCECAYAWKPLGRVYDQDMGEAWVRATTERACPLHGDDRPTRPALCVIPPGPPVRGLLAADDTEGKP